MKRILQIYYHIRMICSIRTNLYISISFVICLFAMFAVKNPISRAEIRNQQALHYETSASRRNRVPDGAVSRSIRRRGTEVATTKMNFVMQSAPELISDITAIPQLDTSLIERLKAWVTYALRTTGAWFYSIGIDIGRLMRLAGELIVGIFEALAQFARWLFSLGE